MVGVCLDTDILVNIIRGRQPLNSIYSILPFGVSTTSITLLELYYGAYKSGKADDVVLIDSLSKNIPVIGILEDDVKLAGKIMAELDKAGTRVDFRDVVIGSICINRGLSVLTKNLKHFERMRKFGLSISIP